MYSCTNNLSLLTTFDIIIYTKSQQVITLSHSLVFYCLYRFRKTVNLLFLLVSLYNIFQIPKNIIFNLTTTILAQNKNTGEYT